MREPRIILFDLETLPNLTKVLDVYPGLSAWPGLTLKADITSIICGGWKIYGEKKVNCINAWDFKTRWKKDVNDDYMVVKKLREILITADAVVTHNGKRFDWKHLQTRLVINKLPPLPKILHIDTCAVAKANLYTFNNKLNTMGNLVGDKKKEHEGWSLWSKVWNRKTKAMKDMESYCKQDVLLLEKVFKKLMPFIKELPNYGLYTAGNYKCCVNCGSTRLLKDGYRYMKNRVMRRWRCKDCGSHACEKIENVKPTLTGL